MNYERKLGKEALGEVGGEGGGVGNDRSKGVYPEEDILIAASSKGERDEPSLQCNPASSSMRFTVPDGATSFINFKIKSCLKDVKSVISRPFPMIILLKLAFYADRN